MQWMVIWMKPYFIKAMEVDWASWIWLTIGYKTYHYNYYIALAKNNFRLDYTSIFYIYKVFKHLTMQWMVIWMHPYFVRAVEVGWARLNLSNKWVNPYYYKNDMAEARNHLRVDYTSILCIYKVFNHLLMQWMVLLTSRDHVGVLSWLNLSNK
jgi:hypothetical protein